MMCDNCARLTRELREAREELREYERPAETHSAEVYRLNDFLGRPCQLQAAKMILMLMERPGQVVLKDNLIFGMQFNGSITATKVLHVNASRARAALIKAGLPRSVRSAWDKGYYIEQKDADMIRAAMEGVK